MDKDNLSWYPPSLIHTFGALSVWRHAAGGITTIVPVAYYNHGKSKAQVLRGKPSTVAEKPRQEATNMSWRMWAGQTIDGRSWSWSWRWFEVFMSSLWIQNWKSTWFKSAYWNACEEVWDSSSVSRSTKRLQGLWEKVTDFSRKISSNHMSRSVYRNIERISLLSQELSTESKKL